MSPAEVSVAIYGIEGKLIKQIEKAKSINIQDLPQGLYFFKIHDLNGRLLKTEKVVKRYQ